MSKTKGKTAAAKPGALFGRIVSILEQARGSVVRAVNTSMVLAYWLIGREIVEETQRGSGRAKYGENVIEDLSARLTERYGDGFSPTTLQYFRKFFLAYPERCSEIPRPLGAESGHGLAGLENSRPLGVESSKTAVPQPPKKDMAPAGVRRPARAKSSLDPFPSPTGRELVHRLKSCPLGSESPQGFSPQLSWSHYRALMRVENREARDFYEREAVAGGWDKRTLERQIQSFYYERILKSRKPEKMLAEGRNLPDVRRPFRRAGRQPNHRADPLHGGERDGGPLFRAERPQTDFRIQVHAVPADRGTVQA